MPELIVFVACEKVIIDQRTVRSLIGIFQRMQIQLQAAPLPENALSPTLWNMFALWQHTEEEIGRVFHQRVDVFTPNGTMFARSEVEFKVLDKNDLQSKNTFQFFGIPINEEGFIRISTWLGDEADPREEYRYFVEHQRREINEQCSEGSASAGN